MMHNKLDKLFGQAGSVLGWLFIVVGILFTLSSVSAAFILTGSFMAFSYSAIKIDSNNKKFKFYYSFFGFINIGKWKNLTSLDGIAGITPMVNRLSYAEENNGFKPEPENGFVVLFKNNPKRKIPFKKCKDLMEAQLEAQKIAQILNLKLIQ